MMKKNNDKWKDNKNLQKKEKTSFFTKVFEFPSKLNRTTYLLLMILILALSSVCLYIVSVSAAPSIYVKNDKSFYSVEENSDNPNAIMDEKNHFIYNNLLNTYIEVANENSITDDKTIKSSYRIRLRSLVNKAGSNVYYKYNLSFLDSKNNRLYLDDSSFSKYSSGYNVVSTSDSKTIVNYKQIERGINEAILTIDYGTELDKLVNRYSFTEKIIKLNSKEVTKATNIDSVEGVFGVSFDLDKKEENNYYEVYMNVNVLHDTKIDDVNVAYHIDGQSFVVCENGEILPLIGVYNYGFSKETIYTSKNYRNLTSIKLYEDIKPKYLVFKGTHTNKDGLKNEILYKVEFSELLK